MALELYGTASCPYTGELRDELEWQGATFVEYDVGADERARERLRTLAGWPCSVPVLVRDGRIAQIGWHGRSCYVGAT